METKQLNQNQLTTLPPEIGQLTALKELHVSLFLQEAAVWNGIDLTRNGTNQLHGKRLSSLPPEIGLLTQLELLWVRLSFDGQ